MISWTKLLKDVKIRNMSKKNTKVRTVDFDTEGLTEQEILKPKKTTYQSS